MNAKYRVLWISLFVIALFAGLSVTQAQTGDKADVVTVISNSENDAVRADLANPRTTAGEAFASSARV